MHEGTPLAEMLRATRRFLEREVDGLAHDRAGRLAPQVIDGARGVGLFGLGIPETFGGLGLSLAEVAAIVAEIARVDRALATTVGLHNGLGTRALIDLAPEPLQREWLPRLARGEGLGSFAATEPGAGSDLVAVRTTMRRTRERLQIDGEKAYVTNAGLASVLTVLTRDADARGRTTGLVLVPRDARGVDVGPEERKMGLRASSTCAVRFDATPIPAENLLSGRGVDDAHRALAWGRVLLSAGCLGTAATALERTLAHAQSRRQFGRPLIELGAVRHHLAAMAAAEATIEHVLATACAAGDDLATHAGALKVLASELAHDSCDRAVQLHGALGFLEDPGIALLLRDCRVTRIFEGANDVLLVRHGTGVLAERGLVRARDWCDVDLGPRWTDAAMRLEDAVFVARREHGVAAVRHQRLLQALARADLWLHAARCTLSASAGAREARRIVLGHAARRALDRVDQAIAAAGRGDIDSSLESEVVDALLGTTERAPVMEVLA